MNLRPLLSPKKQGLLIPEAWVALPRTALLEVFRQIALEAFPQAAVQAAVLEVAHPEAAEQAAAGEILFIINPPHFSIHFHSYYNATGDYRMRK